MGRQGGTAGVFLCFFFCFPPRINVDAQLCVVHAWHPSRRRQAANKALVKSFVKEDRRLTEELAVCLRKRTILVSEAGQMRAM